MECDNGHDVPDGQRYCGACGAESRGSVPQVGAKRPRARARFSLPQKINAGLIAVVVVAIVWLVAVNASSPTKGTNNSNGRGSGSGGYAGMANLGATYIAEPSCNGPISAEDSGDLTVKGQAVALLNLSTPGWASVRNATPANVDAVVNNPGSKFVADVANIFENLCDDPQDDYNIRQYAADVLSQNDGLVSPVEAH